MTAGFRHFFSHKGRRVYPRSMYASNVVQLFKSRELRRAWLVALAADSIQILLLPLFVGGALSPADLLVDCGAALLLTRLLGWHWAFLPTIIAELSPGFDLFPTWTAAMVYVTLQRARSEPQVVISQAEPTNRLLNS